MIKTGVLRDVVLCRLNGAAPRGVGGTCAMHARLAEKESSPGELRVAGDQASSRIPGQEVGAQHYG
jgi:hypothetical protein